jgi:hypothetical protein
VIAVVGLLLRLHLAEALRGVSYCSHEISWMRSKDPTFLAKIKDVWDHRLEQNDQLVFVGESLTRSPSSRYP